MVIPSMYYKIQELKTMGYSNRRAARELGVDRATVRKYSEMDEEEYIRYNIGAKTRDKLLDPYRDVVICKLEEHPDIPASVIYDFFLEKDPSFAPSKRSVRLYVAKLREELGIPTQSTLRQYEEVAPLPPGKQAQVDMGQQLMKDPYGKGVRVYIFTMSMSHSRHKYAYFQTKPFRGDDFVMAHDSAFRFFGGRTDEIVYDQDRVMTVSENGGNVIFTETFEAYKNYAGFSVYLCRGSDPQSKGKIESVVKYVKRNFLKYRTFFGVSQLNSDGLAWLDRTANGQMHETTKLIPSRVFSEERKYLKAAPTISKPVPPKEAIIRSTNVIHYKQNRYQVPKGSYRSGRKAEISIDGDKIRFVCKDTGETIAEHVLAVGVVGRYVQMKTGRERNRGTKNDALKESVIGSFAACPGAKDFVMRILEKFPRYNKDQLRMIAKLQRHYSPDELEEAVSYCVQRELFSADDFRATLTYLESREPEPTPTDIRLPEKYSSVRAQTRPVSEYAEAFEGGVML